MRVRREKNINKFIVVDTVTGHKMLFLNAKDASDTLGLSLGTIRSAVARMRLMGESNLKSLNIRAGGTKYKVLPVTPRYNTPIAL